MKRVCGFSGVGIIKGIINVKKIIITQSILWAAAIISTAIVAPSEFGWLILAVLATTSIGTLRHEINAIKDE
ncbi:hypothetical protein EYC87_01750 [Halieaceae bacterium IMCC8485]|uniref:Uncharacterized protein n=1 Tax=Candidatus Seongchinamella marina TaxID=2518990 RepID=A0ABT3SQQ8_9GAMM|nr:hypothetical protein [Candidatus Seongchinamella marina]